MERFISIYVLAIIGQSCTLARTARQACKREIWFHNVCTERDRLNKFLSPVTLTMPNSKLESLDYLKEKCKQIINFLF